VTSRVSVIIPAFNAEAHIREALRSVEAQTYGDWEVVVADDCSTDRTPEIAKEFGERFKVVANPENAGPATARNLAITHSSGELLAFLDADDYWLPEFLERQVDRYDCSQAGGANVGIVACNARVLGPNGFLTGTLMDYVAHPGHVTLPDLLRSNSIFVSAISPRAIVVRAGGFCAEIFGAEDHDLWVRILELGYRVIATQEPLAVYRVQPGSVSASAVSMARATQKVYRRALERSRLTPRERRIARRELRLQRAVEQIASADGVSYGRVLRALPLLVLVAAENPRRWPSLARRVLRGRRGLSLFPV
jgi:teichuronic acid biosynthesis glycosyltransferase TuaG